MVVVVVVVVVDVVVVDVIVVDVVVVVFVVVVVILRRCRLHIVKRRINHQKTRSYEGVRQRGGVARK